MADIEALASFSTRDILVDEEITLSYEDEFALRVAQDRHRILQFACPCKACVSGTAFQQPSDMRQTLIRGLSYLTRGVGVNGKKQEYSPRPIILSPELRHAAEQFSIPISFRLLCYFLFTCLVEKEGLLSGVQVKRLGSRDFGWL
jgi:hypothetical protein